MQASFFILVAAFVMGISWAEQTYHLERTSDGSKDILEVTNSEGEVVEIIEAFTEDDYQLVKPTAEDDYVCLVFPFTKESEGSKCFKSEPYYSQYMDDPETEERLADCEDREIYVFQPVDCSDDAQPGIRRKRAGCLYEEELVSVCVKYEKYCTKKRWWGKCKSWGYKCVQERAEVVRTERC